jgi:uncharacterized protein
MIVVSDTSPLTYLIQVGEVLLLKKLFDEVVIPPAVYDELNIVALHQATLKELLEQEWLNVQTPANEFLQRIHPFRLDKGETEALALALALKADYIIIDERSGSEAANQLQIPATGLIGVLIAAKKQGMIPAVKPLLDKIIQQGFFITKHFYQKVLLQVNE